MSVFAQEMALDFLFGFTMCVVLSAIGRHLQNQPGEIVQFFEEGDLVYIAEENLEGEINDIENSGRIWVRFSNPIDFQWYTAESLKKII